MRCTLISVFVILYLPSFKTIDTKLDHITAQMQAHCLLSRPSMIAFITKSVTVAFF